MDARAEARQMLQKHGVNNIPVNVEQIARAEGFTIERRPLGADAGEVVGHRITVNGDDPLVRQRFTIAHELGHLALHTVHGTDEYSERQCEVFAGALLVPRDILRKEFALNQDPTGLAKRFVVSREAMWIELQDARLATKIG